MNNGWVKLNRKMFDNTLWLLEPFTKAQAWVDLFANANHKTGEFSVRGNIIHINRGQIGWSEITMTKRWKWSRQKVRRFLEFLEKEGNIRQQKTSITSITTIVNYDRYQLDDTADDTAERQQKDSRRYTNKNDKKNKNENKEEPSAVPSQDIVLIIDSFKEVNPVYKRWYGNITQRSAITRMLETHGKEQLCKVIAFLPRSNLIPYIPTITTPLQLEEKWATLKSNLVKEKLKLEEKQPQII